MPPSPPTAPSNLVATAITSTQIDLTWDDNSNNEHGFYVYRSLNGVDGWTEIGTPAANVEYFSDETASPETQYFYRVSAQGFGGESGYSNVADDTTPAAPSGDIPQWDVSLNEAGGNNRTDSVNGNAFAEVGGTVGSAAGKIGNAAVFDGNVNLQAPYHASQALGIGWTIMGWVKLDDLLGSYSILGKYDIPLSAFDLILSYEPSSDTLPEGWRGNTPNLNRFRVHGDAIGGQYLLWANQFGDVAEDVWAFIALRYDGRNLGISVNGGGWDEIELSGTEDVYSADSAPLTLGSHRSDSPEQRLIGMMDQWVMFGSAISNAAVQYHYNAGSGRTGPYIHPDEVVGDYIEVTPTASVTVDGSPLAAGDPWPFPIDTVAYTFSGDSLEFLQSFYARDSVSFTGNIQVVGGGFINSPAVNFYPSANFTLPALGAVPSLIINASGGASADLSGGLPASLIDLSILSTSAITLPASLPSGLFTITMVACGLLEADIDDLLTLLAGRTNVTLDISGHVITPAQQITLEDHIANDGWSVTADWNP